ncbi:hypothetical protein [Anabaena sp. PCC 7108]|uniref:hypothetical protein n=1 Tax=Anabaena sp. PCC 7108 TaxID=163908 RepID=UPI00034BFC11|nr:hypothetical protein [Anabaena sp. PCC 7108]
MPKSTLAEVFGQGATQTATSWTIQKADFPTLEASATNSGSALLAAILIENNGKLTKAAFDADVEKSIYIEDGFSNFIPRGETSIQYRVDQIVTNLAQVDSGSTLDPDNY